MIVDSKQEQLTLPNIVKFGSENIKSNEYSYKQIYVALMKELTMPSSLAINEGNTVFIVHKSDSDPRVATIRAINADTARNYLENSKVIASELYNNYGIDIIVSQFDDPSLLNIWKYVAKDKPADMGYKVQKTQDGGFQVTAQLGKRRG